ncbi:hypothetical protein PYDG_00081 [Pseudoalteromonas phage pYD6-A]|uniref:Uncharacterized protein n=1 Tax=Pseudoalteromonas phage pYD6-A TaxID=754052 RepID=M4SQM8_9CAUD|nr:hypothetical protein PYDG_00081 [Pseudoalteromonas phage pYD6-A]AGH57610.1 hypothetical protein PYDG_00081 [Pseudoalteromonas phage pYD6-A]
MAITPQQQYDANNQQYLQNTFGGLLDFGTRLTNSAANLVTPSYWGNQFSNLFDSINNNLIQQTPSTGVYQGTGIGTPGGLNSTGVLTNNGPAIPSNRGFTPIATPQTTTVNPVNSMVNNSFSSIGSSPVTNAINNTTAPTNNFTPFTGGFGNVESATGIDTANTFSQSIPTADATTGWSSIGDGISTAWDSIGGWQGVQAGLNTASGLFQAYQGMEALDLAQDKFNFQRDAWRQNFAMQKDAYDRQVAQVESRKEFLRRGDA